MPVAASALVVARLEEQWKLSPGRSCRAPNKHFRGRSRAEVMEASEWSKELQQYQKTYCDDLECWFFAKLNRQDPRWMRSVSDRRYCNLLKIGGDHGLRRLGMFMLVIIVPIPVGRRSETSYSTVHGGDLEIPGTRVSLTIVVRAVAFGLRIGLTRCELYVRLLVMPECGQKKR